MRAVVLTAVVFALGCNEGHPELRNGLPGAVVDAATAPDLTPVVVVDMTPGKTCGQLAVCVLGCGQDLACYAGCGTGAPPSELIAAVSLGACAFASCIPRGDGGLGGIIGGGTGGGGGGLGGLNPVMLFTCLSASCSMQLSMCDGLLGAFGGFGGPM